MSLSNPERHIIIELILKYGLKSVVEVGVLHGKLTGKALRACLTIERYYCVDPWKVYCQWYHREAHPFEADQAHWDKLYGKLVYLQTIHPQIIIKRMTSLNAAWEMVQEVPVDVVYIDAVHDQYNILNDIYHWMPIVRDGGIIAGHDYAKQFRPMVEVIRTAFKDDINLVPKSSDVPRLAIGNAFQSNWWVFLNKDNRHVYRKRIEDAYGDMIWKNEKDREDSKWYPKEKRPIFKRPKEKRRIAEEVKK
jgi:hypothetical protein